MNAMVYSESVSEERNTERRRDKEEKAERKREGEPNRWRKAGWKELDLKHRKRDTENGKGKQTHR